MRCFPQYSTVGVLCFIAIPVWGSAFKRTGSFYHVLLCPELPHKKSTYPVVEPRGNDPRTHEEGGGPQVSPRLPAVPAKLLNI